MTTESPSTAEPTGAILGGVALALAGLIALAAGVGDAVEPADAAAAAAAAAAPAAPVELTEGPSPEAIAEPTTQPTTDASEPGPLPHGARRIFGNDRVLVAYYGTAETGALGVLGETHPDKMHRRVMAAAAPYRRPDRPVQAVYELIVTIADRAPGPDGDYSHDIARAHVRRYIKAAHRHDALLLLDIQPGRSNFLTVAKRWEWALRDPYVGLALDPEWRLGRRGVPAQRIGSVSAEEVNRTSAWLRDVIERTDLPQKLFVLHQFRTDMLRDIDRIEPRRGLVMVQHVDGFGTQGQKLDTYTTVARPGRFVMGLKLFYDEDVRRFTPRQLLRIQPRVQFVSYQ